MYKTFDEYKKWLEIDNNWAYYKKGDFSFSSARTEIVEVMQIKDGDDILDIGCSDGKTLKYLKENYKVNLYGIEPDLELVKDADNYGNIFGGTVEDWLYISHQEFDSIIMADVIEHLLEPWTVVREVTKRLKKGGSIYASIPNFFHASVMFNLFSCGSFAYFSSDLINKDHLRYFTLLDSMVLFKMSGLTPELLGGIKLPINNQPDKLDELVGIIAPFGEVFKRNDYFFDVYQFVIKATKE